MKLKFKSEFFKSSNKYTLYNFFLIIFSLSAKYYQVNKERLQKQDYERYQNLSKKIKKKQQYGC